MGDIHEITQTLQARADELRSAADELARIEAALAALQAGPPPGAPRRKHGQLKERVAAIVTASLGLRSTDIAREAGITPANVARPLKQLLEDGRLQRDDAKRWVAATAR